MFLGVILKQRFKSNEKNKEVHLLDKNFFQTGLKEI